WMNHFGDPGYKYHTLMSQLWGVTALRLANADLLPFDFATYASNIREFVTDLAGNNKSVTAKKVSAAENEPSRSVILTGLSAERSEAVTQSKDPSPADSTRGGNRSSSHGFLLPTSTTADPKLDMTAVMKTIDDFESAGRKLNESLSHKLAAGSIDLKLASTLNHGMMQVEHNWLNPDGIPGRTWFKHILYGTRYTYAHLELPGLTEAVEK